MARVDGEDRAMKLARAFAKTCDDRSVKQELFWTKIEANHYLVMSEKLEQELLKEGFILMEGKKVDVIS